MELTRNELQFMTVLWHSDTPLTSAEILGRSVDRTWKDASLHIILNRLIEKGAVAEHGFVKDGKVIARTFVPALSRECYYESVFAGYPSEDIPMLFSALLRRVDFNVSTIEKLEDMIRERRVKLEDGY